ncbi:MAG: hypothetical protein IJ106_13330 [Parasporobacterium sp.]|nr:hypothetical protein [Parasporobacterium sp.]
MKDVPVKLGPLALLLTVICICMTTLAILTFTTAQADLSLANKYADTVTQRYQLEKEGQTFLAQTTEDLARGILLMPEADGLVHEDLELGNTTLHIALRMKGSSSFTVDTWKMERKWEEDTKLGNLWDGTWR